MTPKDREPQIGDWWLWEITSYSEFRDELAVFEGNQGPEFDDIYDNCKRIERLLRASEVEQLVVEARNEGIREAVAAVQNTFDKEWSDTANELKCGCGRFLHQTVYLARCAVSSLLPKEDQP